MAVELTYDTRELQQVLKGLIKRMGSAEPAMEVIGETVLASIQRNFEEGGRPEKWQDLAGPTKKQREKENKWPGQILVKSGTGGGLLGSIHYDTEPDKVIWYAGQIYAAIHHFGGEAGKGHKATIPERPYMIIQDEDLSEITEVLSDFIIRG